MLIGTETFPKLVADQTRRGTGSYRCTSARPKASYDIDFIRSSASATAAEEQRRGSGHELLHFGTVRTSGLSSGSSTPDARVVPALQVQSIG